MKQMFEPVGTMESVQAELSATKHPNHISFLIFLPIKLDDSNLFSVALDLLAATGADQVVYSSPCCRYVVRTDTGAMEQEQGILASVVLPNTDESRLAVKAWAVRAAKRLGIGELRFVTHEVYPITTSASQKGDAFQLGFDGW